MRWGICIIACTLTAVRAQTRWLTRKGDRCPTVGVVQVTNFNSTFNAHRQFMLPARPTAFPGLPALFSLPRAFALPSTRCIYPPSSPDTGTSTSFKTPTYAPCLLPGFSALFGHAFIGPPTHTFPRLSPLFSTRPPPLLVYLVVALMDPP